MRSEAASELLLVAVVRVWRDELIGGSTVSGTEGKVVLLRSVLRVVLFPSRNFLESLDEFSHSWNLFLFG